MPGRRRPLLSRLTARSTNFPPPSFSLWCNKGAPRYLLEPLLLTDFTMLNYFPFYFSKFYVGANGRKLLSRRPSRKYHPPPLSFSLVHSIILFSFFLDVFESVLAFYLIFPCILFFASFNLIYFASVLRVFLLFCYSCPCFFFSFKFFLHKKIQAGDDELKVKVPGAG